MKESLTAETTNIRKRLSKGNHVSWNNSENQNLLIEGFVPVVISDDIKSL